MELIFSSFWTFAGTVILIIVSCSGLAEIISAVRGNRFEDDTDEGMLVVADVDGRIQKTVVRKVQDQ
jgi:hypothetical protein